MNKGTQVMAGKGMVWFFLLLLTVSLSSSRLFGSSSAKPNSEKTVQQQAEELSVYPINWKEIKNDWIWVFGGHLMTEREKEEYKAGYRKCKTLNEREDFQTRHRRWIMVRIRRLDPEMWERYYGPLKKRKPKNQDEAKTVPYPINEPESDQEDLALHQWKRYYNKLRHIKNDSNWIFGGHLMTSEERKSYQARYHRLETVEERADFRSQHRTLILQRAELLDPEMFDRYESYFDSDAFYDDAYLGRVNL